MTPEDADAYRRRISEVLRQNGFGWVVEHAEAQIAEGKPSYKQVSERYIPADTMFTVRAPKTRRASLVTSEPYSPLECLEIILQAIGSAIVNRFDLEESVLSHVKGITEIEFRPDAPAPEAGDIYFGRAHRLTQSRLNTGSNIKRRAEHALEQLEGEAHAST
jgi:hypothetical protein